MHALVLSTGPYVTTGHSVEVRGLQSAEGDYASNTSGNMIYMKTWQEAVALEKYRHDRC